MFQHHDESVRRGEGAHRCQIGGIGAVPRGELLTAQDGALRDFPPPVAPLEPAARRAARRRTSTVTSSRSVGSAGATTRAPGMATRSLPFKGIFAMMPPANG